MSRFADLLAQFFYRPDEDAGALTQVTQGYQPLGGGFEELAQEYLAFRLVDETYVVAIEQVREIVKVPPLTEVPRARPELLGVMNLRGEVVPVYDVRHRLHLQDRPAIVRGPADVPRAARVVLLRDELGDAGILVDAVNQVVKLNPAAIEPKPAGTSERAAILGVGRKGEQLYIVLDTEQVLA